MLQLTWYRGMEVAETTSANPQPPLQVYQIPDWMHGLKNKNKFIN
jgi:hypothetical protein